MNKFVLVLVGAALDGQHHFVERVLEDVVGSFLVFHYREDAAVNLGLLALEQHVKARGVTLLVASDKFVVCQLSNLYIYHVL